jgi:hypothetical protein
MSTHVRFTYAEEEDDDETLADAAPCSGAPPCRRLLPLHVVALTPR